MRVKLKGGLFDGCGHDVYAGQHIVRIQHSLTMQQWKALRIDDRSHWNPPDEVYEREVWVQADGTRSVEYIFKETVHHKPKD